MLAALIESLAGAMAQLLNTLMQGFLAALDLDLGTMLEHFSGLETVYTTCQSIAIALAGIIAITELAKFGLQIVNSNQLTDSVPGVLLWTILSVALIFYGGYICEFLVDMGKDVFTIFKGNTSLDASTPKERFDITLFLEGFVVDNGIPGGILGTLFIGLSELFLVLLIGYNLFQLVTEVCERWIMVAVLVFFSPLAWATLPSSNTRNIWRKWLSMFIGSLIMMSMSVIFLNLVIGGLSKQTDGSGVAGAGQFILQLIMVLAMCKVGQHMDSYLQQLGIGVATTGSGLFDDIVSAAKSAASTTAAIGRAAGMLPAKGGGGNGEGGGSRSGILGQYAKGERGLLKAAKDGMAAARETKASGKGNAAAAASFLKSGGKELGRQYVDATPAGRAVKSGVKQHQANKAAKETQAAMQNGGKSVGGAAGKNANGTNGVVPPANSKNSAGGKSANGTNGTANPANGKNGTGQQASENNANRKPADSNTPGLKPQDFQQKQAYNIDDNRFAAKEDAEKFAKENHLDPNKIEKVNADGTRVADQAGFKVGDKTYANQSDAIQAAKQEGKTANDVKKVNPDGTPAHATNANDNPEKWRYNKVDYDSRDEAVAKAAANGDSADNVKAVNADGTVREAQYAYNGSQYDSKDEAVAKAEKEGKTADDVQQVNTDGTPYHDYEKNNNAQWTYGGETYKTKEAAVAAAEYNGDTAASVQKTNADGTVSKDQGGWKYGTQTYATQTEAVQAAKADGHTINDVQKINADGSVYKPNGAATQAEYTPKDFSAGSSASSEAQSVDAPYATVKEGRSVAAAAIAGAFSFGGIDTKSGTTYVRGPETNPVVASQKAEINAEMYDMQTERSASGNAPVSREMREAIESGDPITPRQYATSYTNSGIGGSEQQGVAFMPDAHSNMGFRTTYEATAAGLEMAQSVKGDASSTMLVGKGDGRELEAFMALGAANYGSFTDNTYDDNGNLKQLGTKQVFMNTVNNAPVDTVSAALSNPKCQFNGDSEATQAMFRKVYAEAVADMPGQFNSLQVVDRPIQHDGQGNVLQGGRMFVYTTKDDSGKIYERKIFDSLAMTSMHSQEIADLKKYIAADGSTHLHTGSNDISAERTRLQSGNTENRKRFNSLARRAATSLNRVAKKVRT